MKKPGTAATAESFFIRHDPSATRIMSHARTLRTLIGLCFAIAPASASEPAKPAIVAHRGLLKQAPENTLANFRACVELRLGFEFDVARTRDGHLVCIHDDTVDRTTGGSGKVSEMTLEEVRRLDAGHWFGPEFAGERVPTIDEVLQVIAAAPRSGAIFAVDLKVAGAEREIVDMAVKARVLDRLLFIGRTIVEPGVRANLRKASPNAKTAAVAHDPAELAKALNDTGADWIYFRYLPSEQ